jgi:uncharacterized protein YjbI with pentapeptide repeats
VPRRVALCVGINKYLFADDANLEFARADAESLSRVFSDKDREDFECTTLLDHSATKEEIISTFNRLLCHEGLGNDDFVLFYFSGHAGVDVSSNLYLVAHDTKCLQNDPTKIDVTTCVHIRELEVSLELSGVGTIVLIIDACYSGKIAEALTRINFGGRKNITLIGACRHNELSYESGNIAHGLFAACFLEGLNQKPTRGEWITLNQLLSYVNAKMNEYAPQGVEVSAHFMNPDVLIAKNPFFRLDNPSFTKEIRDLFAISRAQIEDYQFSSNFFVAKQTLGLAESKTGVLCLDNQKTEILGGAIDNFLNLIQTLRSRNRLDRGLLVTEREIDPDFASRIELSENSKWQTKENLVQHLMNFETHLQRVVDIFEKNDPDNPRKPALVHYYVDLMTFDEISKTVQPVMNYVEKWLSSKSQKLAILGEYGFGKTVFCKKLSQETASEYLSKHQGRIPILINLGKFPKITADLQALILSHLSQNCDIINPSWAAFERMNSAGLLLLIFDGLDEMAVRTNREIVEQNLFEIQKLASSSNSKIVVTSRPEYFWTSLEEKEILEPKGVVQDTPFEILKLAPFSLNQIKEFLQKRIPFIKETKHPWTYYYERIQTIYDLPDLSKRPVFLEMISETLPKMVEENIPINRYTLYETYMDMEIKRQEIEKRRLLLLTAKDRFKLMQTLAVELFRSRKAGLASKEILELMRGHLTDMQLQQLEGHVADFLACSFLRRKDDVFAFSHQTFLEFLVSMVIYEEINTRNPYVLEKSIVTEPILDFLFEKDIDENLLWRLIDRGQSSSLNSESNTASNVISLLNRYKISFEKNLSRINFKEARLKQANLVRANLVGANLSYSKLNESTLSHANLTRANLSFADLEKANLTSAIIDCAQLRGANLKNAEIESALLKEADLTEANLGKANLSKADLTKAILKRSYLISANLQEANLQSANLQSADLRLAKLQKANMSSAILKNTNLSGAILYGANLSEANLEGAKLADANLKNADFRGANLDTSLFDANLTGIKFDERTIVSDHNIDVHRSRRLGYIDREFANYVQKRSVRSIG